MMTMVSSLVLSWNQHRGGGGETMSQDRDASLGQRGYRADPTRMQNGRSLCEAESQGQAPGIWAYHIGSHLALTPSDRGRHPIGGRNQGLTMMGEVVQLVQQEHKKRILAGAQKGWHSKHT